MGALAAALRQWDEMARESALSLDGKPLLGVQWVGWIHRLQQRLSGDEAQEHWGI
ncbi:MAG: hypothetical protein QXS54_08185 [Candidatus Methanomethylicaceae archaeon]